MNATAGTLSEAGFTAASLNSKKLPEDAWVQTVRLLSNLNRHYKPLYSICEWGGAKSVSKQRISKDIREWVAASFLIGRGASANSSGVALVPALGYGNWSDWPEFALDVGNAVDADARVVGGVWLRTYSVSIATAAVAVAHLGPWPTWAQGPPGLWAYLSMRLRRFLT